MNLTGTWIGEYTYGEGYAADGMAGMSVPFTMSLTESAPDRIVGYVRDDSSRGGQPERGRVLGARHGKRVEFTKTMPVGYFTIDGELVERREYIERIEQIELPPGALPPFRIAYTGEFDATGEALAGEWRIEPWGRTEDGEPLGEASRGTWSARRSSYEVAEV
ncbi:MAG: hypothetical protein KDE27_20590 [Planctomycetes bacterium]|nr:hypothetical protein [Planctomycetota bacterium]